MSHAVYGPAETVAGGVLWFGRNKVSGTPTGTESAQVWSQSRWCEQSSRRQNGSGKASGFALEDED